MKQIDTLIQKYSTHLENCNNRSLSIKNEIVALKQQIENKEKEIDNIKRVADQHRSKIATLQEIVKEIQLEKGEAKWAGLHTPTLSTSEIKPLTTSNFVDLKNVIKPLTDEQVKEFTKRFDTKNSSSRLEDALASLKDIKGSVPVDYLIDIQYNSEAKWPMNL